MHTRTYSLAAVHHARAEFCQRRNRSNAPSVCWMWVAHRHSTLYTPHRQAQTADRPQETSQAVVVCGYKKKPPLNREEVQQQHPFFVSLSWESVIDPFTAFKWWAVECDKRTDIIRVVRQLESKHFYKRIRAKTIKNEFSSLLHTIHE